MSFKLTGQEKAFLYRKYVSEGMDPTQAWERVRKTLNAIDSLLRSLKAKGKTKDDLNVIFKREFAKLCEKEESRGVLRNKRRKSAGKKA